MNNKTWDYRVVRKESKDGSNEWYSIQEIYYDDDGQPMAQTIDLTIEGDTITGMRTQLERMIKCLEKPILDESDITNNEEDKWICEICGKNTYGVDWDYIGSGTNHLGCELEAEMGVTPGCELEAGMGDGHLTKVSKKVKENLKSLRTGKKPPTERGL